MEDLKESSDVLLILFSGDLFKSVIVLGKKDSFLYSVLQRWYLEAFSVGMSCLSFFVE